MHFPIENHTNFLCVSGSHAFGTATETSDVDLQGFCSVPRCVSLSFTKSFEQNDEHDPLAKYPFSKELLSWVAKHNVKINPEEPLDQCIFSLKKFFKLTSDANPNLHTLAFADDDSVVFMDDVGEQVRKNRDLFLSARVRYTYSGYAVAQLKRIETHRRWLMTPVSHDPNRMEFGLPERPLISKDQLDAATALVDKYVKTWLCAEAGLDVEIINTIQNTLTEFFAAYLHNQDIVSDAENVAMNQLGFSSDFINVLRKEKAYRKAKNEWKQYQDWQKNRNPARAEMEKKFGYDCYAADTEFLTLDGWKKFDSVTQEDRLATVFINSTNHKMAHKHNFGIEYQSYTERFDGTFNGNMYHVFGNHIDTLVTPNHKLLIRRIERASKKTFSWELVEAARLPDTFEVCASPDPITKVNYINIPNAPRGMSKINLMSLIGMFLSDGTLGFYNGAPKDIRINQKSGNRLHGSMTKLFKKLKKANIRCSMYKYSRAPNKLRKTSIMEIILSIRDPELVSFVYKNCGHSKEKHIPRFVYSLTKRYKDALLLSYFNGDGTTRNTNYKSRIYYTNSTRLANDLQELALSCGYETSLYGPYEKHMYQVHVNITANRNKLLIRSKNIAINPVVNERIVCFSVPNGILITRRNGHIGIHGNSKHANHLVRLMRMCKEILTTGKVLVKRPDAEELLSIRNGAWTYEQVVTFAKDMEAEIEQLYRDKKYVVPNTPNIEALDELFIGLQLQLLSY